MVDRKSPETHVPDAADQLRTFQSARVDLTVGPFALHAGVRVTPIGLLAIGALVSGILLSTAVVVLAATSGARGSSLASRLGVG